SVVVFYFFFQAEDGIRDFHVTGVQTCALPIYILLERPDDQAAQPRSAEPCARLAEKPPAEADALVFGAQVELVDLTLLRQLAGRSEERRVGKESRNRWAPYQSDDESRVGAVVA